MLTQALRNKWTLIARALPLVLIALGLRFLNTEVFQIDLILKFSDLAPILTGASIVLGLMLTGVIADYREAEKLPAAIGRALDDLDGLARRGLTRVGKNSDEAHSRVLALTEVIHGWFFLKQENNQVWAARSDVGELILDLDKNDVPEHYLHRMLRVNSDLGAALSRVQVIRDTSFISAGYALMELLVGGVILTLSVVEFSAPRVGYFITAGLVLTYSYLVLLAKDIDNPFEHGAGKGKGSAADVDLTPFLMVLNKLQKAQTYRVEAQPEIAH
jgi:hypothetical protein